MKKIKKKYVNYVKFKGCECEMKIPIDGLCCGTRCDKHNNLMVPATVYSKEEKV